MLTQELLKERLSYDPNTGEFRALVKRKQLNVGDIAGCWTSKGYWRIKINNQEYSGHRLAWLYVHGRWPTKLLDHKNRDPSDNRIDNLREATYQENAQNRKLSCTSRSGFLGVTLHKKTGKYQASIMNDKKPRYLGLYATAEQASCVYLAAKQQAHVFNPTL